MVIKNNSFLFTVMYKTHYFSWFFIKKNLGVYYTQELNITNFLTTFLNKFGWV